MPAYTQANGPMSIKTPLGPDVLLITDLGATETISQPFHVRVDLLAVNGTKVPFEQLIGSSATVAVWLPGGDKRRYFNGIVSRFTQGRRDDTFTYFRAEIVPRLWLFGKRAQSRIFQHLSVPDILKKVLEGLDVDYDLHETYEPRNYCVQYRETDLAFASRLMEDEGIYYFFTHADGSHKLVVTDQPVQHPELPHQPNVVYEEMSGAPRANFRVTASEKTQDLRSGKYALWDHTFELPPEHLEAKHSALDSVAVGTVTHQLRVDGNDQLEIYDYPGYYAKRFDGIDRGGGERPQEVQKIFMDNERTVRLRMGEEKRLTLEVGGTSDCRHFLPGHKFTLSRHFDGDGPYVITAVQHHAQCGDFRTSDRPSFEYENRFTCIPAALPYRPSRATHKPTVAGPQTATVVGPAGEEIFCDKYGRVKVQFHWDREGKKDADSSCWIRVSQPWAGARWGAVALPRIGQEVVIDFLEGDPDQPIITGRVYNADQMPPYELPDNKTQSGVKSRSTLTGSAANFNEIRFEDKKGSEQLFIHAEKNQDIEVENDETHWVGHDRTKTIDHDETTHVKHDRTETVDNNETITVHGMRTETVDGNETITIHSNRTETVDMNETITVHANRTRTVDLNEIVTVGLTRTHTVGVNEAITVGAAQEITVGGARAITVGVSQAETFGTSVNTTVGTDWDTNIGSDRTTNVASNSSTTIGKDEKRKIGKNLQTEVGDDETRNVGKKLHITVGDEIVLTCGQSVITMKKDGTIKITGKAITIDATQKIDEKAMNITSEASTKNVTKGAMVNVEASGINTIKGSLVKIN